MEINILSSTLLVYENGEIHRQMKSGIWKVIKNVENHNRGYNVICIGKKQFMRSHIMLLAFHNTAHKPAIKHLDGNRLNCALSNLSIQ